MAKGKKFYVVWVGKNTGIYPTWEACKEQIDGFNGSKYKSFNSKEEAELAYNQGYLWKAKPQTVFISNSPKPNPILPSWSVDAACSGNPGVLEYRGVDTQSQEIIFHQGPFSLGTNNIGEFLALVHALALQKNKGIILPIYTDSVTALSWVKHKKAKTNLVKNDRTEKLWGLIERAEKWLQAQMHPAQIIKWPTEDWGEIPADFGRKG